MDSLKELREWFLEDPETRAAAFKIADYYLVSYDDDREELVGESWDELLQSFSAGDIPEA